MPTLALVQGKVTLDGKPLDKTRVTFIPKDGAMSIGVTDSEGIYQLNYDESHKGAAVGEHEVRITNKLLALDKPAIVIPEKYNGQTTLKATVHEHDNEIDFDLQSK